MLVSDILQFVHEHDLIRRGQRVLAAVSGGSDSIALAHILHQLDRDGDLHLVGLAHFNHQLRAGADRDEAFVRASAETLGVRLFVGREDVAARRIRERRSLEDAARAARYAFFGRAQRDAHADLVALGHTRDDQAETVLLRLVRGAGPRGLGGMHPRNGPIVRPLLGTSRTALRAWLGTHGIGFVDDESNADRSIPRNRVRAELVPLLSSRFNPAIADVLADHAALARDLAAWMDQEAAQLAARIVHADDSGAVRTIDVAGLAAAPTALQRAVLWRELSDLARPRTIDFRHVDAVRRLVSIGGGGAVDAPGQRVERIGGSLVLTGRGAGSTARPSNLFRYPLSIPGEVFLDAGVVSVAIGGPETGAILRNGSDRHTALVRADLCRGSLAVRNRRPGDRFRPLGLAGRKSLQDYFVDRKIPRERRGVVPLVVDADDRIVWVAGHQIDDAFRVTDRSQGVLILTFKALGGSA